MHTVPFINKVLLLGERVAGSLPYPYMQFKVPGIHSELWSIGLPPGGINLGIHLCAELHNLKNLNAFLVNLENDVFPRCLQLQMSVRDFFFLYICLLKFAQFQEGMQVHNIERSSTDS